MLIQDFLLLWMFNRAKLGIHSSIPALLQAKQVLFFFINSLRRHNLELFQYLITCKRHFDGNEKSQTQGSGPKAEEMVCSGSAPFPWAVLKRYMWDSTMGAAWEGFSCRGICSLHHNAECHRAKGMPSLGGCLSCSEILASTASAGSSQG